MRGRMSAKKSYIEPYAVGEPMDGPAVARVLASNAEGFAPGDHVVHVSAGATTRYLTRRRPRRSTLRWGRCPPTGLHPGRGELPGHGAPHIIEDRLERGARFGEPALDHPRMQGHRPCDRDQAGLVDRQQSMGHAPDVIGQRDVGPDPGEVVLRQCQRLGVPSANLLGQCVMG
ncbi:hypothetical protein [Nocardia sp. NBC_01730]|uniref:hypothetical protein n=1 Tax=Nocardia sp. NBC_01730 TaxID=2975998 RepID=UPI003FA3B4C8